MVPNYNATSVGTLNLLNLKQLDQHETKVHGTKPSNNDQVNLYPVAMDDNHYQPILMDIDNNQVYLATPLYCDSLTPQESLQLYHKCETAFHSDLTNNVILDETANNIENTGDPSRVSIAVLLMILFKILPKLNLVLEKSRQSLTQLSVNFKNKIDNASLSFELSYDAWAKSYEAASARLISGLTNAGISFTSATLSIANSGKSLQENEKLSSYNQLKSDVKQLDKNITTLLEKINQKRPNAVTVPPEGEWDIVTRQELNSIREHYQAKEPLLNSEAMEIYNQGAGKISSHKQLAQVANAFNGSWQEIRKDLSRIEDNIAKEKLIETEGQVTLDTWIKKISPLKIELELIQRRFSNTSEFIKSCNPVYERLLAQTSQYGTLYTNLVHSLRSAGEASQAIGDANATQKDADANLLNNQSRFWQQNSDAYGRIGDEAIDSMRKSIQEMQENLLQILREISTLLVRIRKPNS